MKKRTTTSELIAIDLHKKRKSPVVVVSRDGWVITEDGAFGDNKEDCKIVWTEQINYLKSLRKEKGLSQEEMSWILGVSRTTYIAYEQGNQEISHKEFLISKSINESF